MRTSNRVTRLLTLLLWVLAATALPAPLSADESGRGSLSLQPASGPTLTLHAASGDTISFVTQNGSTVQGVPPQALELPRLVLYRNGALTDAGERTLILEVNGVEVPPGGVTVALEIETQDTDPDLGELSGQRIPAWQASQWIANRGAITRTNITATFVHSFAATVASGPGTRATPTGYFRVEVTATDVNHPLDDPLQVLSVEYAFLMENQWIVPLPKVGEASPGAAPDELVVYYCDMFPFRKTFHDPATWIPRAEVTDYVGHELVPRMVEAFRVQSDEWGFPWYEAWTSYRTDDPERLSVALTDERTWFHGLAPSGGHAGISIRVDGGNNAAYDTLTDGLMATFHHELFHNLQRNISLHSGGDGLVGGAQDAWQFFSEGTAVLAQSVGQPRNQFTQTWPAAVYVSHANLFVQYGGGSAKDLNSSYAEMNPYHAALYWRFLYEQCGGMVDGAEDSAAGMQVIRRALTTLYSGEVVDPRSSTDLVGTLAAIMDRSLAGSMCPFQTYSESLSAFARAIYGLRLEGGKCVEPGIPEGCGFYDPYGQYREPPLSTITYTGTAQEYEDGIRSSYGIDLIEVHLDPVVDGQPLMLEFYSTPGTDAAFEVQLLPLISLGEDASLQRASAGAVVAEILPSVTADGHVTYVLPAVGIGDYNRLALIVTRLDAQEASDPTGAYTLALRPGVGA